MPVRITTACTEFGRTLGVGEIYRRSPLHEFALVASDLGRWVDPVSGRELAVPVVLPQDGGTVIPITSRQFLSPVSYGIDDSFPARLYEFEGDLLRYVNDRWLSDTTNVVITGAAAVGQELTATVVGGQAYIFEWLRDGVPIPGAVRSWYVVQAGDVGKDLTVRIAMFEPVPSVSRPRRV